MVRNMWRLEQGGIVDVRKESKRILSTSKTMAPLKNRKKTKQIMFGLMTVLILLWNFYVLDLLSSSSIRTSTHHPMDRNIFSRSSISTTITNDIPLKQDHSLAADILLDSNNFLPRVLAFVFPQFHQDSLNDFLWGKGFTDWNNLNKAPKTNRLGYVIPRPSAQHSLGQYDYSKTAPRKLQGELAKQYGIDGFIFHHYWFYDARHPGPNLHTPLMNMLQDGYPNIPFALHWCASKWTNTWSGQVGPDFVYSEPNILQKQYFPLNDREGQITQHYEWLKKFFHHQNYIKVQGKPLFMMYQKKPGSFPVLKRLNELAKLDGFPGLYFTVGLTKPHEHLLEIDPKTNWDPAPQKLSVAMNKFPFDKVLSYPNPAKWNENRTLEIPEWCLSGYENEGGLQDRSNVGAHKRPRDIAGIISSFDNTPRRNYQEANIWSSDTPEEVLQRFRTSLHSALYYESCCFPQEMQSRVPKVEDDRFVIINAMNEWAEGMVLEPSDVYGTKFLETIYYVKRELLEHGCNL